jgi:GNAT superfamily N-acetyltransferase
VDEKWQSRGIGKLLMGSMENWLRALVKIETESTEAGEYGSDTAFRKV